MQASCFGARCKLKGCPWEAPWQVWGLHPWRKPFLHWIWPRAACSVFEISPALRIWLDRRPPECPSHLNYSVNVVGNGWAYSCLGMSCCFSGGNSPDHFCWSSPVLQIFLKLMFCLLGGPWFLPFPQAQLRPLPGGAGGRSRAAGQSVCVLKQMLCIGMYSCKSLLSSLSRSLRHP